MACYVNYTGSGGTTYDYEEEDDMEETCTDGKLTLILFLPFIFSSI